MSFKFSDKLSKTSLPQEGIASFIRKTYELLEEKTHLDIVSWSDDGNFIVIKDLQKFTMKLLPVYFKHNKMNSFIRQLNMYNFRKKRTMNSYHVYYNDLFKRGKVELLPLIKRKISDSPSSPSISGFNSITHSQLPPQEHDLAYENAMLKKLNQKAISKINTLEAKIADLSHENKGLIKKISDKQKKEDYFHNTFSQFPGNQVPRGYLAPYPHMAMKNTPVYSEEVPFHSYNSYPHAYAKPIDVNMVQMATPETDDTSSPDTFLAPYDSNETLSSGESTEFQTSSTPYETPISYGYYDDSTVLGKRNMSNENFAYEDEFNNYYQNEPAKLPCFGMFDEDRRMNLMDNDFPAFTNDLLDGTF